VLESNDHHKGWMLRHLRQQLGSLAGKRIGILGLAYKAGTDAIRRSVAVEVVQALIAAGADVAVYDPKVSTLPEQLAYRVTNAESADEVFQRSDAVVLATEWPEFRNLDFQALVRSMGRRLVIDQNGFAAKEASGIAGLEYIVTGKVR
jgi:UDPglucose 6-dehydrogenase